jgi:hypothetical protein
MEGSLILSGRSWWTSEFAFGVHQAAITEMGSSGTGSLFRRTIAHHNELLDPTEKPPLGEYRLGHSQPARLPHPGGMFDTSPMLQLWVPAQQTPPSPEGTADPNPALQSPSRGWSSLTTAGGTPLGLFCNSQTRNLNGTVTDPQLLEDLTCTNFPFVGVKRVNRTRREPT